MGSFATNYEEIAAVLLFVIGMSNLVFQPNLLKKIIGLDIMDSAIYLFLAAKGYIEGRTAPIVGQFSIIFDIMITFDRRSCKITNL